MISRPRTCPSPMTSTRSACSDPSLKRRNGHGENHEGGGRPRIRQAPGHRGRADPDGRPRADPGQDCGNRSEEHTSELQSLMRNSYAVFCLKKKTKIKKQ